MGTVGTYEVKTHLSSLLARVEKGERITITRHGVPVAVLVPATPGRKTAAEAIEDIRGLRAGMQFDGLDLKELIQEGRR
jgi:prevent-host-death family protein